MKYNHIIIIIIISLIGIARNNDAPNDKVYSFMSHPDFFLPMIDKPRHPEFIIEDAKMGNYLNHLLEVKVGEPPQILKLKLSTAFCGIWLYNKQTLTRGYSSSLSQTFKLSDRAGSISRFSGIVVKDNIHFLNAFNFENHPFLLINHSTTDLKNYDGTMGLGFKCTNDNELLKEDLIEKCSKHNIYNKKIFWFKINHDNTGSFTVGDYLPQSQKEPKLYRTVNVLTNRNDAQWSFTIHSMYLSDNTLFPINNVMSLGIDGNMLSVSQSLFMSLIDKYFEKDIASGLCYISNEETTELYCVSEYDYHKTFPSYLSFVVGKWSLKISIENLFHKVTRNDLQQIRFAIIAMISKDQFYISQRMLGTTIVVYDKEKNQIGFYPSND